MRRCDQNTITDAAFEHLKEIEKLNMCFCRQDTITDAAFQHLKGIKVLHMFRCRTVCIQSARDAGLPVSNEDVFEFE